MEILDNNLQKQNKKQNTDQNECVGKTGIFKLSQAKEVNLAMYITKKQSYCVAQMVIMNSDL